MSSIPNRLRQMIEERDQGRSELRDEFDRSREDDASVSRENDHLEDSYLGQRMRGDDQTREKTMIEEERTEPRIQPPRSTGPAQDRLTFEQRLRRDDERAQQSPEREEDREIGDDERHKGDER